MKRTASSKKISKNRSSRSHHLTGDLSSKYRQEEKTIQHFQVSKPDQYENIASLDCGLYVVATPIGNLADITLRALEVLKGVDKIACEDTRVTKRLLSRYGIGTYMISYHDHNAESVRISLIEEIRGGAALALVSDAGMPTISDPGYKLIRGCIESDLQVKVVPGASAGICGLVVSGLPTDRFLFQGYLSSRSSQRRTTLREISTVPASLIFYESAKRLPGSLMDMLTELGDRPATVVRELTKLYEEVRRSTLSELAAHYAEDAKTRGEVVVVVGPAQAVKSFNDMELEVVLAERLNYLSLRDAVAEVAAITKQPRKQIYQIAIHLQSRHKE